MRDWWVGDLNLYLFGFAVIIIIFIVFRYEGVCRVGVGKRRMDIGCSNWGRGFKG